MSENTASDEAETYRASTGWTMSEGSAVVDAFEAGWAKAIEQDAAELASFRENFPCDGGCDAKDGPMEECSLHGRSPRDLWEAIGRLRAERLTATREQIAEAIWSRRDPNQSWDEATKRTRQESDPFRMGGGEVIKRVKQTLQAADAVLAVLTPAPDKPLPSCGCGCETGNDADRHECACDCHDPDSPNYRDLPDGDEDDDE